MVSVLTSKEEKIAAVIVTAVTYTYLDNEGERNEREFHFLAMVI
jgi:hypothetical protein